MNTNLMKHFADRMHLAQDKDQWLTELNAEVNF
jgi:hypothetical protein